MIQIGIVFFFFVVTIIIILVICIAVTQFSSKNKCSGHKRRTVRHPFRNDQGDRPGEVQHATDERVAMYAAERMENVQQCVRNGRTANEIDINEHGTGHNSNTGVHSQTYVGTSLYLPILDAVSFLLRLGENNATEDMISVTIQTESTGEPPAYEELPCQDTDLSIGLCGASVLTQTRVSTQPPTYDELPSQHVDSREFILRHTGDSIEPPSYEEQACQHNDSVALHG